MSFAKVWANSARAPNPKRPPSANLEMISATVWPTISHSIMVFRVVGVKEFSSNVVLLTIFDLQIKDVRRFELRTVNYRTNFFGNV